MSLALSWDMSPLRPWEWANLAGDDARRWLEAIAIHNAYAEGTAGARSERQGIDRMHAEDVGQVG